MRRRMILTLIAWTTLSGILLPTVVPAAEDGTPAVFVSEIDAAENAKNYRYLTDTFLRDETRLTLTEVDYTFLPEFQIPGMPATVEADVAEGRIPTSDLALQGICMAGDYLLLTAYSEDREVPGCLFLFDRVSGEYLATLGMKKSSHLGGIAFDGENIWICHSDNGTVQRLSYTYLRAVAKCASKTLIDISDVDESYPVANTPSCITYENGHLYIATTSLLWNGELKEYTYENGGLLEENTYQVPARVQGIAFGADGQVYLSTSYGRRNSSYLKQYANLTDLSNAPNQPLHTIELPPCSEEIMIEDTDLYVLFESAGRKYYEGTDGLGTALSPIDELLTIDLDSIP